MVVFYDLRNLSDKRVAGQWSLGNLVSSTNKTDRHNITEILFKVVLNIITLTLGPCFTSEVNMKGQTLI